MIQRFEPNENSVGYFCRSEDVDDLEAENAELRRVGQMLADALEWVRSRDLLNLEGQARIDAALKLARGEK